MHTFACVQLVYYHSSMLTRPILIPQLFSELSAECNQGINWHNWSHTEARLRCSRSNYEKQDARAKAAKHCSTEKRQQEAQAMAAKHSSNLSHSGLPGVQFPLGIIKHLLLLSIHVQMFEVHAVVVIRACTTWGHIIAHFWPRMYERCNGPQPIL